MPPTDALSHAGAIAAIWIDETADQEEIVQVRRRQSRSIEKRGRILAAAAQEFAEKSFNGATTRSIANRAEMQHALVIYHFETKLGIWQAVMRDVLHWLNDAFEARLVGLEGVDDVVKLRLLQADFVRLAAKHPELHWMRSHVRSPALGPRSMKRRVDAAHCPMRLSRLIARCGSPVVLCPCAVPPATIFRSITR